jgi:hypothetical protein
MPTTLPEISLPDFYSILPESYGILTELGLFVFGMIVYSVFIFQFYRFLARKDIFVLDLEKHNHANMRWIRKTISVVMYVFKFLILFPVFAFVWFVVLAVLLSFMAKDKSIENVFLVSMGVLGSIRIAAYYNEALSTDLAKILPFWVYFSLTVLSCRTSARR